MNAGGSRDGDAGCEAGREAEVGEAEADGADGGLGEGRALGLLGGGRGPGREDGEVEADAGCRDADEAELLGVGGGEGGDADEGPEAGGLDRLGKAGSAGPHLVPTPTRHQRQLTPVRSQVEHLSHYIPLTFLSLVGSMLAHLNSSRLGEGVEDAPGGVESELGQGLVASECEVNKARYEHGDEAFAVVRLPRFRTSQPCPVLNKRREWPPERAEVRGRCNPIVKLVKAAISGGVEDAAVRGGGDVGDDGAVQGESEDGLAHQAHLTAPQRPQSHVLPLQHPPCSTNQPTLLPDPALGAGEADPSRRRR